MRDFKYSQSPYCWRRNHQYYTSQCLHHHLCVSHIGGLGAAFIRWISNFACRQIQWNKQSHPKPTGYISKQHMTNKPVKAFHNLCGSKDTVAFWQFLSRDNDLHVNIYKTGFKWSDISAGSFCLGRWCPSPNVIMQGTISNRHGISDV